MNQGTGVQENKERETTWLDNLLADYYADVVERYQLKTGDWPVDFEVEKDRLVSQLADLSVKFINLKLKRWSFTAEVQVLRRLNKSFSNFFRKIDLSFRTVTVLETTEVVVPSTSGNGNEVRKIRVGTYWIVEVNRKGKDKIALIPVSLDMSEVASFYLILPPAMLLDKVTGGEWRLNAERGPKVEL